MSQGAQGEDVGPVALGPAADVLRPGPAGGGEPLLAENSSTHVNRNRSLVTHLQAQKWEPFEIADAVVAGNLY